MTVTVTPLTGTETDLGRWCAIYVAGRAADSGTAEDPGTAADRVRDTATDPSGTWLAARHHGRITGAGAVHLSRAGEAFARIHVPAGERRHGAGRALADAVLGWAREHGVSLVTATIVEGTAGEPFAASFDARTLIRLVTVEWTPSVPVPVTPLPPGCRVTRWSGTTPPERVPAYLDLRRAVADAPGAALQGDIAGRDAAWLRRWEAGILGAGHDLWVSAVVDGDTMVAFTEVELSGAGRASQHDTAVLPDHRGRGLGAAVKADMLARLVAERPDVTGLTSTINARNAPMLAVCRRLGFREVWRRRLIGIGVPPGGPVLRPVILEDWWERAGFVT